jgi:hypothetical protein
MRGDGFVVFFREALPNHDGNACVMMLVELLIPVQTN